MKKKGKKKGSGFKLGAKVEDPDASKSEMQMKKKILQEKYIIQKQKADDAFRKMEEQRTRYLEILEFKSNESRKFKSVESDFVHQTSLMSKNSLERISELDQELAKRVDKINGLNKELEEMKTEHEKKLEEKTNCLKNLKTQMDALCTDYTQKLTEIQQALKEQTEKVSQKWEHNPADHIKTFEEEINNYNIAD